MLTIGTAQLLCTAVHSVLHYCLFVLWEHLVAQGETLHKFPGLTNVQGKPPEQGQECLPWPHRTNILQNQLSIPIITSCLCGAKPQTGRRIPKSQFLVLFPYICLEHSNQHRYKQPCTLPLLSWLLETFWLVAVTCENLPQSISQLHECSSMQVLAST